MILTEAFWKKYFEVYDTLNQLIPYQELLRGITKELELQNGMTVLDAGCGTGNLLYFLLPTNVTVTGIDYSTIGLRQAHNKFPTVLFLKSDLTKPLPFKEQSFNRIVSNNVLYTIPPSIRPSLMREFFRILKPGGIIVLSNIATGFNPTHIYWNHVQQSCRRHGYTKTLFQVLSLLVPTIRIFYYNRLISKADGVGVYEFLTENKQRELLSNAGFVWKKDRRLYANNAVVTVAQKPNM